MKSFYYIWDVPTLTGDCIRRMKQGKRKNSRGRDRKSIDRHYWERVGTFVHIGLAFRGLKLLPGSSHPVGMPRVILWQCRTVDKLMLKQSNIFSVQNEKEINKVFLTFLLLQKTMDKTRISEKPL